MKKNALLVVPLALILSFAPVHAEGNPYPTNGYYWGNCTWGAWQLAYEKLGIELPGMGNAQEWYANAQADGYSVGSTPEANSIVVWSGGRSGLGHVAYVDFVNDDGTIYLEEGSGANHNYNARTADPENCGMKLLGYIYVGDGKDPVEYDLDAASLLSESQRGTVNDAIDAYNEANPIIVEYTVKEEPPSSPELSGNGNETPKGIDLSETSSGTSADGQ